MATVRNSKLLDSYNTYFLVKFSLITEHMVNQLIKLHLLISIGNRDYRSIVIITKRNLIGFLVRKALRKIDVCCIVNQQGSPNFYYYYRKNNVL